MLFAPGSVLNLSEAEFRASIQNKRGPDAVARMGTNVMAEVQPLKALAAAVAQAGTKAAGREDYLSARKHFTALRQCGEALERPNTLAILQLLGQGFRKRAEAELAKLPQ